MMLTNDALSMSIDSLNLMMTLCFDNRIHRKEKKQKKNKDIYETLFLSFIILLNSC